MKKLLLSLLSLLAVLPISAEYTGRVYVDRNSNGQWDRGEKLLQGIKVSDGLQVVETDAKGCFSLPGHERARFVFITTPSGYMASNGYYRKIEAEVTSYDFGLEPFPTAVDSKGNHRFIQISDTEIGAVEGNEAWARSLRDYSNNEKAAFIIHTGDICYVNGLKSHIKLMNTRNMGVPVYYCIGNHDLVNGKYGEELFESIYGPVFYSFEVGNVHYVVTPMSGGDYRPSYTFNDVARWLKNDLAHVKKGTPIIAFNHDLISYSDRFVFGSGADTLCLSNYNLKAFLYGHWHMNLIKKQGSVHTISTATVDKGGIDHSTSSFRVMHIDGKGDFRSEMRHAYIDKTISFAAPQGETTSTRILVNTYSSVTTANEVVVSYSLDGKSLGKDLRLTRRTDWTWEGELPMKEEWKGCEIQLKAVAHFANGGSAQAQTSFVPAKQALEVKLGDNWDNLLGNAQHTGVNTARFDSTLQLAWSTNVGSNLWMCSPLIHDGKVLIASYDDDNLGKAHLYALNAKDGTIAWSFPLEQSVKNSIAVMNGKVFAQDVLGHLYAVEVASGKLAWDVQLPLPGLPALVDGLVTADGKVYAGTGMALSAFNADNGNLIWRNKDWGQHEGTTSTLAVDKDVVIGSTQWGALYSNRIDNGKCLWSMSEYGMRFRSASAALHNSLLYIVSDRSFFIVESLTGRIIVRKELPYNVAATSTPLLTKREIIFGTSDKGLVALDNQTMEEKWLCPVGEALVYTSPYTRTGSKTIETSPVAVGKNVYFGASDGRLYGVEMATGKVTWQFHAGAPFFNSVAVSGNVLVAGDMGGNVYLFTTGR